MNPAQLLSHFDRISEAPDAIPHLRCFILDLAVRGKLLDQDPSDEPASELFKRIKVERARLLNGGEKKKELLPELSDEDRPFELPHGWCWVRFGEIYSLEYGDNLPAEKRSNTGEFPVYGSNGIVGSHSACFVKKPCIVVGRKGSAGALNLSVTEGCCVTDVAYYCIPPRELDLMFSFKLFHTIGLVTLGKGIKPGLNRNEAYALPLALPPLAEQHRIVAKVDELMALCDRLEATQAERESWRDRLAAASLHGLNNGVDADAFREHARFYFNHLPRLTTRPGQIQQLRQTILNLAVRGKLVPQDPNVERVMTLYKDAISSFVDFDERVFYESLNSFIVPRHWGVEPLARIASAIVDCPHSTPKWTEKGKVCVRTNQFRPGYLDLSEVKYVSEETYLERIDRLEPIQDDILYSREGGILGVACRVPSNTKMCLGQRMMLIRAGMATDAKYLEMVLNSPLITEIARVRTTGGAAPRVNVATVKAYPIPLPPLAEQHRIVAKVDELMALCDRLEAQLSTTQTESRRLLESILHEALAEQRDLEEGALR